MSAPVPSTRRLALAIGAAAASATVAIGVTAASLLGWFRPAAGPPASETAGPAPEPAAAPVILVPVTPTPARPAIDPVDEVQLAMGADERGRPHADHDDDDDDDEEGDDD